MTREDIIQQLQQKGYNAVGQDVIKNGVVKQGIVLKSPDSNISPTVYADDFIKKGLSATEAAEACIRIFDSNRSLNFDIKSIFDKDFLLKHSYLGLQKSSTEDICKEETEYEGIEKFLYLRLEIDDGFGSIKLNQTILDLASTSYEELLPQAEKNTFAETKFINLSEMFGLPEDATSFPLTCITNAHKTRGAAAILDKKAIKEYAEQNNIHHLVAIPSSIHEFILFPCMNDTPIDLDDFAELIKQVNADSVLPEEQLGSRAYIINL